MNKQVRVFQIKEIHHKQRAKSYAQQIEDGFLIHHQNYQSAYKGQVGPSETPVTVRGRLEEQRPNTFIGRPFGVSDVMVWDEEEKRKFFYVDKDELVEFGGFTDPLAKRIICTCGRPLYWHKDKKTGEELFYCSYCRAHKENGKELKAPAASVYKKVIDAMEREHRKEEKMYSAIQQGAGRKAIEEVRADSSMQMKTILAELNMEQFRRVPLYESYMADEITEEQYQAEVLDYEEAHRKLNEQLTTIMENTMVWERALSLRNPWIQQMEQYKTPEALDRNFVKKYIEQVVVTFLGDRQAEISLTMKTEEWKQMLERIELEGTDDGTKK